MKAIDFRNETFDQLHQRLTSLRREAYQAWRMHGPGTTRQVAARSGMDILTFRPRTTELYQIGLVVAADVQDQGSEGVYRALTLEEWKEWYNCQRERQVSGQQQLI